MNVVAVYNFTGRFTGPSEYEWHHPEPGATHQCLLFLRQEADTDEHEFALAECRKYGFSEVAFSQRGKLQAEMLDSDPYRGFAEFYKGALNDGSVVVYHPNRQDEDEDEW